MLKASLEYGEDQGMISREVRNENVDYSRSMIYTLSILFLIALSTIFSVVFIKIRNLSIRLSNNFKVVDNPSKSEVVEM